MNGVTIRAAQQADIENMGALIFEHGPNPWNHLPPVAVTAHLQAIAEGSVQALLAERAGEVIGFVSYEHSHDFQCYQPVARADHRHAYICEAVTHRDMAGRGLGSRLLSQAVEHLLEQGIRDIYIDRHEENAASAGMMRKAGFVELDTYADAQRRPNGSGRTTLCCWRLA